MAYSSITKPGDYFNTKLYTGTGATRSITGIGFQPDWIWTKGRSGTYSTESHKLYDAVRGTTKELRSDVDNGESTNSGGVTSFDSDGYGLGAGGGVNGASTEYVSWNWKANGQGSANSDGTITTTYTSANTTSGFSIIKYSGNATVGATIGHGLNSAPEFVFTKKLSASANWQCWGSVIGNVYTINLNHNTAKTNPNGNYNNDTNPNSTVVTLGNDNDINQNGEPYVMYCFHSVKGYSKIGTYTGNGNADGTFVYTGFKPAFLLVKRTDSSTGGSWILYDNKRGNNVFNPTDVVMAASNNQSESDWGTNYDCDFLSNGIKWRYDGSAGYGNTSGATYIYMAFAENPLVANVSGGLPATAR